MYLNMPTTRLVRLRIAGLKKEQTEATMTTNILYMWKELRAPAKEKDKVMDLERALKEAGKIDHAEILMDKYQNDQELTADCFPSS